MTLISQFQRHLSPVALFDLTVLKMSSRAASSVKLTIPKSGYFVEKAGPHSKSFVNRRAIYFGEDLSCFELLDNLT
jgi:hypothetical protein